MSSEYRYTYKKLSDGSYAAIDSKDPDVVDQKLKEKELEIQRRKKLDADSAYKASPDYQPGATLEKEDSRR